MKAWAVVPSVLLVTAIAFVAWPTSATGGGGTVRIVTTGDAYLIALSAYCTEWNSGPPTGDPLDAHCWLAHGHLGYDGVTGAILDASAHVNHAFRCEVVASSTGVAFNGNPYPTNVVGADSFRVVFDCYCDMYPGYTEYGGRLDRPPIGAVQNRMVGALGNGDVVTAATAPVWYLEQWEVNGPTPVVTGNVDFPELLIFNEGGSDVTVECTF